MDAAASSCRRRCHAPARPRAPAGAGTGARPRTRSSAAEGQGRAQRAAGEEGRSTMAVGWGRRAAGGAQGQAQVAGVMAIDGRGHRER